MFRSSTCLINLPALLVYFLAELQDVSLLKGSRSVPSAASVLKSYVWSRSSISNDTQPQDEMQMVDVQLCVEVFGDESSISISLLSK